MTFTKPGQRPQLLTFLCVLSFVGSGLGAVSNLFVYFNHSVILEMLDEETFKTIGYNFDLFAKIDRNYFILTGLLQIISFNGVRFMWKMRRAGFHLYAIAQLMMLIVSTIYIYKPANSFPMLDLLLTTVFILLFLRFRDQMQQ